MNPHPDRNEALDPGEWLGSLLLTLIAYALLGIWFVAWMYW